MASRVQFFGEYLVAGGHVSRADLERALDHQRQQNLPLGQLARQEGLLSEDQVAEVHHEQRRTDERFGELAVSRGFLERADLDRLLEGQAERRVYLGQALAHVGALDADAVAAHLATFEREQAEASERVRSLLLEAAGEALVDTAVALTVRMLLRMALKVAKARDAERDPGPLPAGFHSFRQEVRGESPFTYTFSAGNALLLELTGVLLDAVGEERPTRVDETVIDAGKELVNVIVGQTCVALGERGRKAMPQPPEIAPPPAEGADRVRVVIAMPEGEALLDLVTPS